MSFSIWIDWKWLFFLGDLQHYDHPNHISQSCQEFRFRSENEPKVEINILFSDWVLIFEQWPWKTLIIKRKSKINFEKYFITVLTSWFRLLHFLKLLKQKVIYFSHFVIKWLCLNEPFRKCHNSNHNIKRLKKYFSTLI